MIWCKKKWLRVEWKIGAFVFIFDFSQGLENAELKIMSYSQFCQNILINVSTRSLTKDICRETGFFKTRYVFVPDICFENYRWVRGYWEVKFLVWS